MYNDTFVTNVPFTSVTMQWRRMLYKSLAIALLTSFQMTSSSAQEKQEEKEKKSVGYSTSIIEKAGGYLKAAGLRRSGKTIVPINQAEQIRNLTAIQRKAPDLKKASEALTLLLKEKQNLELAEFTANRELRDVNVNLATPGRAQQDAKQLTAMNNALVAQINDLRTQQNKLKERIASARGNIQTLEAAFIEQVSSARKALDESRAAVEKGLGEKNLAIAFEVMAKEFGTPQKPEIGTLFKTLEFRVHQLEQMFLKESVPLVGEGSGTKKIAVSINGSPPLEMILDSGADLLLIPKAHATRMNLILTDDMPQIMLGVADGRTLPGRIVMLSKVRVGPFEASNVEAAVLESEAGNLEPLLGMSFLGNFQFQVNSAKNELLLTQIKSTEAGRSRP